MNIFNESHSVIFNGHTYLGKFFNDLSQAKRSVVISATKLWFSKRSSVPVWGIERSGFFNGREKWAKGFENQRV